MLALASPSVSRGTYISENAIQPAQVNTYWGWTEVRRADELADLVVEWNRLPPDERADAIEATLHAHGLSPARQQYSNGTNVFATLRSTKSDGAERVVLAAPWLSRHDRQLNVRGVALVLALSDFLNRSPLWSKDITILIADGFSDGATAWAAANAGSRHAERLKAFSGAAGPVWTALLLDYPYHSFSHLEIHYEGPNGRVPNLDYLNSIVHIARWAGGSEARIHHSSSDDSLLVNARQVVEHSARQLTRASGPEAAFLSIGADSLTLFAVPSEGPHGFYSLGKTVESTLRSVNNLLERLHQSFFLYLLVSTGRFVSIGNYIGGPIAVGAGLTISGLSQASTSRSRTVLVSIVGLEIALRGLDQLSELLAPARSLGPASLVIAIIGVATVASIWPRGPLGAAAHLLAGCRLCALALVDVRSAIVISLAAIPVAVIIVLVR